MKTIGRLILSAIFLVLTGLVVAVAASAPDFVFSFYSEFSRNALGLISTVTAWLPFALWEVLVVLIVLWVIYTLVRSFGRHGFLRWLSGLVLGACVAAFLFVALWGLNHYGPSVAEQLTLDTREYTQQELLAATKYYAAQASELSAQVTRDSDNLAAFSDFSTLSKQAGAGYASLSNRYSLFSGSADGVKKLAAWQLFSRFGTTGIFVAFTAEACVNPDTYETWIPFTMCHELAHRQSVAAEDEANFCAYLACEANSSPEFQYSGAFAAYIYCNNALAAANASAASEIWNSLAEGVRADSLAANAHYAQYEGEVQDAAQAVNDAYLKAFNEESGVKSYGEATDLLIAWYLQKVAN